MNNILLLGSSGLIGTCLCKNLLNMGYCIDAAGRKKTDNKNINFIEWDIFGSDIGRSGKLVSFYKAVIVSAWAGSGAEERNNEDINMSCAVALGNQVKNIMEKCRIDQIILIGSQAEYGRAYGNVGEDYVTDNNTLSSYGRAKLYLYESLKKSANGVILTELRFHSVFGAFPDKRQMLQNSLYKMIKGEDIKFYSDGNQHYDFICADDAACAVIAAIEKQAEGVYNVGSGQNLLFRDYLRIANNIAGNKSRLIFGESPQPGFSFNSDKFRRTTGWKCRFTFSEGIKKMISDLKYSQLQKSEIIIYGAGFCGLVFSDMLLENGIKPSVFFDSDRNKHGMQFNSINISEPYECRNSECIVIVCMLNRKFYQGIRKYLNDLGYIDVRCIYEISDICELFKNQPLIFNLPDKWREINEDKLNLVKNNFRDDLSVEIYENIIEFACGKYDSFINSFPIEEQYFAYDIYKKISDEVFIDCGAFRGDILRYFTENSSGNYEKYIAIEPDPENYRRIEKMNEAADCRVNVIKCALSDKPEILRMKNYLNENSLIGKEGFEVYADTLDNICGKYNIKPTFIKIDVEGFEEKLINGAIEIIKKYKPLIAAAVYHKPDDLWRLPLKIKEILPDHSFFLRSYMNLNETVLYAVPKERLINNEIYK